MVKPSDVKLNRKEVTKLLKHPKLEEYLAGLARKVEAEAKRTAPVGETGAYKESIESGTVENPTRVVGRVRSTVAHGWAVEARTGTLSKALDAAKD